MNSKAALRRLNRLSATARYRHAEMYEVSASMVLTGEDGFERRLVRLLRHRQFQGVVEEIRKAHLGDDYVPTWKATREDRLRWNRELEAMGAQWLEEHEDSKEAQKSREKKEAAILARRHKAEVETGPPVAFLLPFPLSVMSEYLSDFRPNPEYDRLATAEELVPVYADGSVGDGSLYPISGPF